MATTKKKRRSLSAPQPAPASPRTASGEEPGALRRQQSEPSFGGLVVHRLVAAEPWFSMMECGQKRVHCRPATSRTAAIQPGDALILTKAKGRASFRAVVTSVNKFPTFAALVQEVGVTNVFPKAVESAPMALNVLSGLYPGTGAKTAAVAIGLATTAATDTGGATAQNGHASVPPATEHLKAPGAVSLPARIPSPVPSDGGAAAFAGQLFVFKGFSSTSMSAVEGWQEETKAVASGRAHTVFLGSQGRVAASGNNHDGQLGFGDDTTHATAPRPIPLFSGVKVAAIACGAEHSAALTEAGALYCWGKAAAGQCGTGQDVAKYWEPQRVLVDADVSFIHVSCGVMHTVAVSSGGACWSWGSGFQLGLDRAVTKSSRPQRVETLADFHVLDVACGGYHTLALVRSRSDDANLDAHKRLQNGENQVWSWGKGSSGQLGHGSAGNLPLPERIAGLDAIRVTAISAGMEHSAAITCLGHVYTWGSNTARQLGRKAMLTNRPALVPSMQGKSILAVACGDQHTVFMGTDPQHFGPLLFLAGKDSSAMSSSAQADPIAVELPRDSGDLCAISCGGNLCHLVCNGQHKLSHSLRRMASAELQFVNDLRVALRLGLLPLRSSGKGTGRSAASALDETVDALIAANQAVWQVSCNLAAALATALATPGGEITTSFLAIDPFTDYREYVCAYANVLAAGAFKNAALEKAVEESLSSSGAEAYKEDDRGPLQYLFSLPMQHMERCEANLVRLGDLPCLGADEQAALAELTKRWAAVQSFAARATACAEDTMAFWNEFPHIRKQFAMAERRVLRHSKLCSLTSSRAVLHSSNWFILFNDIFVHAQMFSCRAYPLQTLWVVEDLADETAARASFRIITPEDSLVVHAPSLKESTAWVQAIQRAIRALTLPPSPAIKGKPQPVNMQYETDPLPLVHLSASHDKGQELGRRRAMHQYRSHPLYKEATYDGEWSAGKPEGHGRLTCSDGRVFEGQFRDGVVNGFATLDCPRTVSNMKSATGTWRNGTLHGFAKVKYYDASEYKGNWNKGVRHGHGTIVYGNGNKFSGAWLSDACNGYGVFDDVVLKQKYLGLWQDGHKQGFGVVVVSDGTYFEGDFQNHKFQGRGLLLSNDNTCFDGEFTGDCWLHGKGRLSFPNGDSIDGIFSGSWYDQNGIKMSNATYHRKPASATARQPQLWLETQDSRGQLAVDTDLSRSPRVDPACKWSPIFEHCKQQMTSDDAGWDSDGKEGEGSPGRLTPGRTGSNKLGVGLPTAIPDMRRYLAEAFHMERHPLNVLLDDLTAAFHTGYKGTGAHRRLLTDAVAEVESILLRIDDTLAVIFPELRDEGCTAGEVRGQHTATTFRLEILEPLLFSRIYSVLYTLYVLNTEDTDKTYRANARILQEMPDVLLCARLSVNRKFWLIGDEEEEDQSRLLQSQPGHGSEVHLDLVAAAAASPPSIGVGSEAATTRATGITAAAKPKAMRSLDLPGGTGGARDPPSPRQLGAESAPSSRPGSAPPDLDSCRSPSPPPMSSAPAGHGKGAANHPGGSEPQTPRTAPSPDEARAVAGGERYAEAIETLKGITAVFSPAEKLNVLHRTFDAMVAAIRRYWGERERLTGMDDVLPLFLMVVVRADISHLGSEVRFLDDFIDSGSVSGESHVLLTTLRACYCQLQMEM